MATILLQAAGAWLGGFLGSTAGVIGSAVGAMAGYWVDQTLIRGTHTIEGQRLKANRPFSAEDGTPLPRLYGTMRMSGTMIWATRFEEVRTTSRQGGKGMTRGAKVTEYSYHANVAFALCEGEIAGVRRIWADGRELDQTEVELRVYKGDQAQMPDPLIEAKQGAGNAPAYRGTAYVVFERFPLAEYGNRIPQFQFEVMRPVGRTAKGVRAVCMIPGSSEYALSSDLITATLSLGQTTGANRHVLSASSDLEASLDELLAVCPNLEHVALTVTWFGDDLRCGNCKVRPTVVSNTSSGFSANWLASGIPRALAAQTSEFEGLPAFGGSPSDASVRQAIAAIKARGLKVTLYPLLMMDIAADNTLPDPYGGTAQSAYPWRGRMTGAIAPGLPGTTDGTAAARSQINAFLGSAAAGDFTPSMETILFGGSPTDFGYRRFILHFAKLAQAAGGVDAFLIGSELRGLTTLRDDAGAFPFVEGLCSLAADARSILGPATKITYGADWSEYFGHQPADGSGDVLFHLDALWAHPAIDAVGIDNYMPLADWRDEDWRGVNPDGVSMPEDQAGLRAAVARGEGYDWYYANGAAREARARTPITDGAYGKPWVYRYKDLIGWWSNQHFNRIGGVEAASPTAWMPGSKPIWFTELGCPAVDKGANQPNVFADKKSAESAVPYFSNGGRSDAMQQAFLHAHFDHWDPAGPTFDAAANPLSPVYGGRMVDAERLYLWAWDARPFPAFPLRADEWSDAPSWQTGHWLNGRLASARIGDVVDAILADSGLPPAETDQLGGTLAGYIVEDPGTARGALEPIVDLFGMHVLEEPDGLRFLPAHAPGGAQAVTELVWDGRTPALETTRPAENDLPTETVIGFHEQLHDYQPASAMSRRNHSGGPARKATTAFPGVLDPGQAKALLEDWLRRKWFEREMVSFGVGDLDEATTAGAIITLPSTHGHEFIVVENEDGVARQLKARRAMRGAPGIWRIGPPRIAGTNAPVATGRPHAVLLDLPMLPGQTLAQDQLRLAVRQSPWRTQAVFVSPETTGYAARGAVELPATMGSLVSALAGSVCDRVDSWTRLDVDLLEGELASVSKALVLNGANAAAIQSATGSWEVIQFEAAEEIAPNRWRLTRLLRGQLGTEDAMAAGALAGSAFVLPDGAVTPAGLRATEIGLTLNWRIGPASATFSDANFLTLTAAGGLRARLPYAPAHLRGVVQPGGDLALGWIRRARIGGDDWELAEIPLDEPVEGYRVEVVDIGGVVRRSATAMTPNWTYAAATRFADLGPLPHAFDIRIRQIGAAGEGIATVKRFEFI